MDIATILHLVKERVGIRTTTVRDTYIIAIIEGIITELEDEKGLVLDSTNSCHQMFVVDYSTWRYQGRDSDKSMPRHLQFRLHNLLIHNGGGNA